MKREDLFEAISNIESRYIEEADPTLPQKKRRGLRPYLAMAAALVLVIGLAAIASQRGLLQRRSSDATAQTMEAADSLAESAAAGAAEDMDALPEEAPAAEEAMPEAATATEETAPVSTEEPQSPEQEAEETEEGANTAPEVQALVYWNGEPLAPAEETLLTMLPEECTLCDTLKNETGAVYYTEEASLAGGLIWMPTEKADYFYVEYPDGYQRYLRQMEP